MTNMKQPAQTVLSLLAPYANQALTLLAIDGHSAAGKTSLARAVAQALSQVSVVHMDDFYRPMREEDRASLDAVGGYQSFYDWQRLESQVLIPLANGQMSRYQQYNWATNRLDAWVAVLPEGVVIVEGCYAARPELRPYYQGIILVETSARQRNHRQDVRADASPEWLARWDAAERYYMEQYRPQTYADAIVSGADRATNQ